MGKAQGGQKLQVLLQYRPPSDTTITRPTGNRSLNEMIARAKLRTSAVAPGKTSWAMGTPPSVIATATTICFRSGRLPRGVTVLR